MIELRNIYKSFKDIVVFENMSVTFEKGVINYIKGVNGSGKSILLKLIVGYSIPQNGSVMIDGLVLHEERDFIPNAGVSINSPEFLPSLTGLENLIELANINKKIQRKDILKWVNTFEMSEHINKRYSSYSLGMKQKLRLIQAFMEKPKYLILDEPFDALDKRSVEVLKNILLDYISDKDNYILMTSHDTSIEDFVDVIYEIDNYKVTRNKD